MAATGEPIKEEICGRGFVVLKHKLILAYYRLGRKERERERANERASERASRDLIANEV